MKTEREQITYLKCFHMHRFIVIAEGKLSLELFKQIPIHQVVCIWYYFRQYPRPTFDNNQLHWVPKPFITVMEQVKHLSLKALDEFAVCFNLNLNFQEKI